MINEVDLFWRREERMTVEAQSAAGSWQLPFGADGETAGATRQWEWLAHRYAEGHDRDRPQVSHFQPSTLRKHKQKSLFLWLWDLHISWMTPLIKYLDICSDRSQPHHLKKIYPGQRPHHCCNEQFPRAWGLGLSMMAVLGSALHAPLVMNNYLTSYQILQTNSYVHTPSPRCIGPEHFTGQPPYFASTWSPASLVTCFSKKGRWTLHAPQGFLSDTGVV